MMKWVRGTEVMMPGLVVPGLLVVVVAVLLLVRVGCEKRVSQWGGGWS